MVRDLYAQSDSRRWAKKKELDDPDLHRVLGLLERYGFLFSDKT